jgi:hypothetical protein
MSQFLAMLSQYEVLVEAAKYLSPLDLVRLGLTSSGFYTIILHSTSILDRLKLTALCDGSGLQARQTFEGFTLRILRQGSIEEYGLTKSWKSAYGTSSVMRPMLFLVQNAK